MRTFDTALSNWLTLHTLNKKPRTQEFNREIAGIVRKHWIDLTVDTHSITADALLAFATLVAHYCPSRWNGIVSALRFVSPEASVIPFRRLNMRQFSPPDQKQFDAFLAECDSAPRSQAGLIVRFLLLTGMRINEARLLRWQDVKADKIEVPGNITKNSKGRDIPLLDGSGEVLKRLKAISKTEFVLPRGNARKAIQSACRRAGVKRMSHHDFRHYFATKSIESGVDMPTVARWLGHQDGGALLAKTYFHLVDGHSREMAARVKIGMVLPVKVAIEERSVLPW